MLNSVVIIYIIHAIFGDLHGFQFLNNSFTRCSAAVLWLDFINNNFDAVNQNISNLHEHDGLM